MCLKEPSFRHIFVFKVMKKKFVDMLLIATEVNLIKDGKAAHLDINRFREEFRALTEGAYYMPGMAIAQHNVIMKEKATGYWLEFIFKNGANFAEFSFDTLTLRVRPNLDGFNVIRGNNGEYSGKTYYLQLATDTTNFYDYIVEDANRQK